MVLDWNEYRDLAIKAVSEGAVLLKNDNAVLPLKKGARLAVYGRIQSSYYKSGTGSGGMVNVSKVTGILDALMESPDVDVDGELLRIYRGWEQENPFDKGIGWGNEPFSQAEMPLAPETARSAAERTDTALVIIGRIAAEDEGFLPEDVVYHKVQDELDIPVTNDVASSGSSVVLAVQVEKQGLYALSLTASSVSGELSQMPVTVFTQGTPVSTFTWNGTGGKDVTITKDVFIRTRYTVLRLYFAQSGLQMKSLRLKFIREATRKDFFPEEE